MVTDENALASFLAWGIFGASGHHKTRNTTCRNMNFN